MEVTVVFKIYVCCCYLRQVLRGQRTRFTFIGIDIVQEQQYVTSGKCDVN